jgi:hypothetical protein
MRPELTFAMPIGEADSTVAGAIVAAVEVEDSRGEVLIRLFNVCSALKLVDMQGSEGLAWWLSGESRRFWRQMN